MHSSSKAFTFVLCCSSFTSHMLKVVSSKAEKHKKKKIAFVADCREFYFSCFSPKTKNIPCTHEIYAVGFFSLIAFTNAQVFMVLVLCLFNFLFSSHEETRQNKQ